VHEKEKGENQPGMNARQRWIDLQACAFTCGPPGRGPSPFSPLSLSLSLHPFWPLFISLPRSFVSFNTCRVKKDAVVYSIARSQLFSQKRGYEFQIFRAYFQL